MIIETEATFVFPQVTMPFPPNPQLGDRIVRPSDGMPLVYVPAGTFTMGGRQEDVDANAREIPPHDVTLDGYWIDQFEVSNTQFAHLQIRQAI